MARTKQNPETPDTPAEQEPAETEPVETVNEDEVAAVEAQAAEDAAAPEETPAAREPKQRANPTREIIVELLREHGPLHVKDITERVIATGKTNLGAAGKTPAATIAAMMLTSARKGQLFVKTAPNTFGLLGHEPGQAPAPAGDDESPAVTPNSQVIRRGGAAEPDPKPAAKRPRKAAAKA